MSDLIDWSVWRPLSLVERSMAPEVNRIALGHWWHGWPEADCRMMALTELRRVLVLAKVCKPHPTLIEVDTEAVSTDRDYGEVLAEMMEERFPDARWRRFAFDLLTVEIETVGTYHAEGVKLARAAALAALQDGKSRRDVATAAVEVARGRMPLTPPGMVRDAIEAAAREFRFSAQFWRKRERTG